MGIPWEVNLHYPPELHDLHNEYPLAADSLFPFSKRREL